ncbi:LigA protein [Kutzneria sp. 744]|nr:LigA protein [Kutzneria sp. 744]
MPGAADALTSPDAVRSPERDDQHVDESGMDHLGDENPVAEPVSIVPARGAQLRLPADGTEFALLEHNGRLIDVTVVTRSAQGLDSGPLADLLGAHRSAWLDGFAVLRWSTEAPSLAGALGIDRAALEDAGAWRTLVVGPLPVPVIDGARPAQSSVLVDGELAARLVAGAEPFRHLPGGSARPALTQPALTLAASTPEQAPHQAHHAADEITEAEDGAGTRDRGPDDDFGGLDLLGPGELAERARRDRPAVEGDIDGAGLRDEIAKLLGRKARGDDSMLRRLVDSVFSDQSLKQYLPQAFDGGMVVDFGTRGSRGAEVTIEAVSVGKPRPPRPRGDGRR